MFTAGAAGSGDAGQGGACGRGAGQDISPLLRAALFATAAATLFFSITSILIRHVSAELHPLEIVFFRNLLALVWMTSWLLKVGTAGMKTERMGLFGLRAALGMTNGFCALILVTISDATVLSFLPPIFATVGAAPWPRSPSSFFPPTKTFIEL